MGIKRTLASGLEAPAHGCPQGGGEAQKPRQCARSRLNGRSDLTSMSSMGGDDIDTRAELLLDELAILPVGQNVDFNYWRGRFQTLFDEKLDDQARQTLLMSYGNMPDFVERSLVE